jgi:hypothetical protein
VGEAFIRDRLADLRRQQQSEGLSFQAAEPPAAVAAQSVDCTMPVRPSRDERAELDLLLAIFTHPGQAGAAAREVVPADLTHSGLRRLYEVCWEMIRDEQPPTFDRVSLVIEDRALLRLAVDVDELARASDPGEDLLEHSLAYFRRRHELEAHRQASEPELADAPVAEAPPGDSRLTAADLEKLRRATKLHRTRTSRPTSYPNEESARAPAG